MLTSRMDLTQLIQGVTEHLKSYLLAGTLVAVGVDVSTNVTGSMGGAMSGPMGALPMAAGPWSWLLTLGVQGIGALIAAVGAVLYVATMWVGYVALRQLRFRFAGRGVVLKACGWSVAFLYVLVSAVIGLAVNAVYLALVS